MKMSNIVASKFGQRPLVELPPFNLKTRTSVPVNEPQGSYSNRRSDGGHAPEFNTSNSPRNNRHYQSTVSQTKFVDSGETWGGETMLKPTGEKVIVKEVFRPRPDKLVQPVIGQSSHNFQLKRTMPGHDQHAQGVYGSHSPIQHQYSPQAPAQQYYVAQVPQIAGAAQSLQPSQTYRYYNSLPGQSVENVSQPTRNMPAENRNYGNKPKEKHVFYGPDGKVIPGPPPGFQLPGSMPYRNSYQTDFQLDAVLEYGRVKSLTNMNNSAELPEYLLRCLAVKYGEYEVTDVRIIYERGQFNVHGVPRLLGSVLSPSFEHFPEVHGYKTPPIYEMP